ncbi:putative uncharacterized protein [Mycolicibacterium brisbanense]|uniref:Uncharacterized protein n=1 Tax=Mycolicibacterium brisbanense TaxID=146020 RepID=A0A117I6J9_9MYCO|nr:putative uncharacterized protein [Mycolicibacterium brisbanense]
MAAPITTNTTTTNAPNTFSNRDNTLRGRDRDLCFSGAAPGSSWDRSRRPALIATPSSSPTPKREVSPGRSVREQP